MTTEIKVPDIGDYHDVAVIDVMVKVGDTVAVDQALCTIETDKAAMDVPSTVAGVVKELKVAVGRTVNKGDAVCVVEASSPIPSPPRSGGEGQGEGVPSSLPTAASPPKQATALARSPQPSPHRGEGARGGEGARNLPAIDEASFAKAHAGPAVRKLARELGVDLGRVQGSGVKGRVTEDDVKRFVKSALVGGAAGGGSALPQVPVVDFARFGAVEVKPLNRIKRISGPRLQAAWVNVPHVTQHDEADITDLETMRKLLKADAEKVGAKLTPLAFLVKASVAALKEFPDFNASLSPNGQDLVHKKYFHIGFAADTPNGLVVPVIKDADRKSVFEIAKLLGEMSAKARDGKLPAADMQGGCFSISSLGGIGGTYFTPIVNAPEVAILGVSKSGMKPVWDGSQFKPRLMLPLSLSYDHRVIDGAAAARFTKFLGEVLAEVRGLVL
jgi:pyruvate dehydrogenase E2 component (dihydrolipoamide acetyltransferase)